MDRRHLFLIAGLLASLSLVAAGFVVDGPSSPADPSSEPVDLWQDGTGTWHVLVVDTAECPDEPGETAADERACVDGVFEVRYGEDWDYRGRTEIGPPNEDVSFFPERFDRTTGGGWWLSFDDRHYRYASNWSYAGRVVNGSVSPDSASLEPAFRGTASDAGLDLDWEADATYTAGMVTREPAPVARGNDGFWYLLDPNEGTVFRYTGRGQYAGTRFGVAGHTPEPHFGGLRAFALGVLGALGVVVVVAAVVVPERWPRYALLGAVSVGTLVAVSAYALPRPLSLVYRLPDGPLSVLVLAPFVAGLVSFDEYTLPRVALLAVVTAPSFLTVSLLFFPPW